MPMTGPVISCHGLDGRLFRREPLLDMVRGVLDNDDGVVHHDADGQDQGKQGHQINAETEHHHGRKGADNGYRHGGGRNQQSPANFAGIPR